MGMSVSPQIWQQLIDLVFQDDLIKCKQNFDVIMDDTFINSTAEEHMDDLIDLFKVFEEIWFEIVTSQMPIFQEKGSLYGTRIPNTRQSMLYSIKRQI